jgi:dTDP-4-dehydrorhamnose 3,5-epimerase
VRVFTDDRGFFLEAFNTRDFQAVGLPATFVQDNFSRSRRGVVRGFHYQLVSPQGKLVRVAHGSIYDVAVDIRRGSPTFGRWTAMTLRDDDGRMLWIPPGFAHGFCALSESADVWYKCTALYDPADDRGVRWNDPRLAIPWPGDVHIVSAKDAQYAFLSDPRADLPRYEP